MVKIMKHYERLIGYILLLIVGVSLLLVSLCTRADELIMADNPRCPYCIQFKNEVAPTYNESKAGKAFPLTIIDITDPAAKTTYAWFVTAALENRRGRINGTPTFFVWKGDRETGKSIGIILGYPGKVRFYLRLDAIIMINN